jgi:hypothetical protein
MAGPAASHISKMRAGLHAFATGPVRRNSNCRPSKFDHSACNSLLPGFRLKTSAFRRAPITTRRQRWLRSLEPSTDREADMPIVANHRNPGACQITRPPFARPTNAAMIPATFSPPRIGADFLLRPQMLRLPCSVYRNRHAICRLAQLNGRRMFRLDHPTSQTQVTRR